MPTNILYPPLVLIGLTFFCLFRLAYLRSRALSAGEISLGFFATYRGDDEPDKLRVHSRHLTNLLETPVLFYVITVIAFVADAATTVAIALAWAYVALRFVHSYIHLTSNAIGRRFRVFALSALVLVALWSTTIVGMLRQ